MLWGLSRRRCCWRRWCSRIMMIRVAIFAPNRRFWRGLLLLRLVLSHWPLTSAILRLVTQRAAILRGLYALLADWVILRCHGLLDDRLMTVLWRFLIIVSARWFLCRRIFRVAVVRWRLRWLLLHLLWQGLCQLLLWLIDLSFFHSVIIAQGAPSVTRRIEVLVRAASTRFIDFLVWAATTRLIVVMMLA